MKYTEMIVCFPVSHSSHHSDSQNGYYQKDKKQVAKMQRKGEPFHCGWEYKAVQPQ